METVEKVLKLVRMHDLSLESFMVSGDDPIELAVICSDIFWWGAADCEPINWVNYDLLSSTLDEVSRIDDCLTEEALILWVARMRKTRPQGAAYTVFDERLWPLFNEAGPERETGLGNPYKPGEYKAT